MDIQRITTMAQFETLCSWATLNVYNIGPLANLEDDEDVVVLVGSVGDAVVAYLIAERRELWHIEARVGGQGYGYHLAKAASINFANEVCSDAGAALCERLGIDFEDSRAED